MTLNGENSYTHAIYEVKTFSSNDFNSGLLTTMARVRNSVARALRDVVTPLPKMLVIVLEDDVIRNVPRIDRVCILYKRCLNWIFNEIRKMLDGHNDSLPPKAKRKVNIVWIAPSDHIHYENRKNRCIFAETMKQVSASFDSNHTLELKQVWDL